MTKRLLFAPAREHVAKMLSATKTLRDQLVIRIPAFVGLREAELVGAMRYLIKKNGEFLTYINKRGKTKRYLFITPQKAEQFLAKLQKDPADRYEIVPVEIPGLRVEDVNFEACTFRIHGKGWLTGIKPPVIQPVDQGTITLIKDYIAREGVKKGRIFDLSTRQVQRIVKATARLAGVPNAEAMSPHRLRAFYITEVYHQTKGNLLVAQRLARHANSRETQRYIFLGQEELEKAVQEIFGGSNG